MSYDEARATHEILKVWDGGAWDEELRQDPLNTAVVVPFVFHLRQNHQDLLNPSLSPDEQYDNIKSLLTTSGRLYKYRDIELAKNKKGAEKH